MADRNRRASSIGIFFILSLAAVIDTSASTRGDAAEMSSIHDRLAAIWASIPTDAGKANFMKQSNNLTKPVNPVLVDLDMQIISCAATIDSLLSSSPTTGGSCMAGPTARATIAGLYLGGQCCGTMRDLDGYYRELAALQRYKDDIPDVPLNPFKTSVGIARKWMDYDKNFTLTADQQSIYDQAMEISKEKPCCCQCWHYFVNEGIGKFAIRERHYTAKQVADFWDSSDICGV